VMRSFSMSKQWLNIVEYIRNDSWSVFELEE
jgi:hypothetical protein